LDWKSSLPLIGLAVLLSAALTITGYYLRTPSRRLIYVCKPLTTILIFITAALPGTFPRDRYALAVGVGLIFSLFGDIWQMLSTRHFLKALICFLITHICYILAFLTLAPACGFSWPVFPLALVGAVILAYLWPALPTVMKGAVSVYVAVIVVMVSLAANRALACFSVGALSAAIGAFLFLVSDAVLAVNRFRRPFRLAQAVILSSYFAGQLLIALSVGLRVL
jgi:uncharacterized membrane protein YhhN